MVIRSTGAGTGGARRSRAARSAGPWAPVVEACQASASRFSDPNAMEGINALDTSGDAVEALGNAMTRVGETITDGVAIDPRVAPFIEELGRLISSIVPTIRDSAAAVHRAHQPKIDRIENGDPKERAWDLSAHDGR